MRGETPILGTFIPQRQYRETGGPAPVVIVAPAPQYGPPIALTPRPTYPYSMASATKMAQLDIRLQLIMIHGAMRDDIVVLTGHRGRDEQQEAFRRGFSKVQWPNGRHNTLPSLAVDFKPVRGGDLGTYTLAGRLKLIGEMYDIPLRWGGDFNSNANPDDDDFKDPGHLEISMIGGVISAPTAAQTHLWATIPGIDRLIILAPQPWRETMTRLHHNHQ